MIAAYSWTYCPTLRVSTATCIYQMNLVNFCSDYAVNIVLLLLLLLSLLLFFFFFIVIILWWTDYRVVVKSLLFGHTFQLHPWRWQSDAELSLCVWRRGCVWCHSSSRFTGSNIQHRQSVWNLRHRSCQIYYTEGKATANCVMSAETPSDVHWKRFYLQLTCVHSALELSGWCALLIYLLSHLLTCRRVVP